MSNLTREDFARWCREHRSSALEILNVRAVANIQRQYAHLYGNFPLTALYQEQIENSLLAKAAEFLHTKNEFTARERTRTLDLLLRACLDS